MESQFLRGPTKDRTGLMPLKRTFGLRKGLLFAILYFKNVCFRYNKVEILISISNFQEHSMKRMPFSGTEIR